MFVQKCLGRLAFIVGRLLKLTLRTTIVGQDRLCDSERYIFAFWHGKQFMPSLYFPDSHKPVIALVSASRDGQIMSTWLEKSGYQTIRGSSSRKAVSGLVMLLKSLKRGQNVAVTPDGPRGPIFYAKPGVAFLASKTGCAIVPFGSAISRKWIIQSWDRYEIPKPFAKSLFYIGAPLHIPEDMEPERASIKISQAIRDADLAATRLLHGLPEQGLDGQCPSDKKPRSTESA